MVENTNRSSDQGEILVDSLGRMNQQGVVGGASTSHDEPINHSQSSSRSSTQTNYSSHLNTSEEKTDEQNAYLGEDLEAGETKAEHHPSMYDYPRDGDELSRIELNAQLSRELSRKITNTGSFLLQDYGNTDLSMGENIPFPPKLPDRTPYCVSFNGLDDPCHPHNLPFYKKMLYSASVAMAAFSFSMGSSMFSQGTKEVMAIYHVGDSVVALGTSLFVFGFAAGPVIHGPMSELFGRKPIMVISCFGYVCFSFAAATAKDLQTIMICRYFSGFTGSAPFVVAPAVMVDMFKARVRGMAMSVFACVLFGGPMIAPILGGFIVKNPNLGWRWTLYMSGIIGCLSLVMNAFILKETHHPVLLVRKAELLRRHTGNWGIFAPHEEVSLSLNEIVRNNIMRPLKLLFTEPIVFLVSIYNAFAYGMLYALLTVIPIIFSGRYHWSQGVGELPYVSMLLGVFSGGAIIVYSEHLLNRKMDATGKKSAPEARLPPVMIGGFAFVIGIFWLGWTGDYAEHVHWIVPVIGAFFVGNGLMLIFLPTMNYIIDCYLYIAASALAGNTFLRSSFGAAFPLFTTQMFNNLTVKWAATLLGGLSVLMIPLPFIFYKYGAAVRHKSKYAMK
ncbi:Tpo2 polyamine transport protein [Candida orthopsilosis Co 90-125]|uniref:Tpo2 polyamine transport protein n=1 Tax=Candida orthopsilosis (strain 90-125) TaxID=1136231 RepID=H8XBK7_CANO9|nr:Tpo2 polyamine transport protein [Candida orthopsilosis Co 90-125]CCG25195.1 Tpo2 polyamine transport protein [Candida orthopsilosis Co 90-125]